MHLNVISDFRMRKYGEYYDKRGEKFIKGMKIIPLETSLLKDMLKTEMKYPQIYQIFETGYNRGGAPKEWYDTAIVRETSCYHVGE